MKDIELLLGNRDHYNSVSLKQHTVAQLKKEYRRFRKEAVSRIAQLKVMGYEDSDILKNKEYLNLDPSMMTKRELINYLTYTVSFVESKLSTVEGQQEREGKVYDKLRDLGYSHITKKTAHDLNDFMKKTKYLIDNKIYSSDTILALYDLSVEKNISRDNIIKNIDWYVTNMDRIEELELNAERQRPYTMTNLKRIFAREE